MSSIPLVRSARRPASTAPSLAFMSLNNECAADDGVHLWGACATFQHDLHSVHLGKPALGFSCSLRFPALAPFPFSASSQSYDFGFTLTSRLNLYGLAFICRLLDQTDTWVTNKGFCLVEVCRRWGEEDCSIAAGNETLGTWRGVPGT